MDLRRDVLYALRAFRQAPVAAVTIVGTVGLGLGLVTVAFTIFNTALFRVDRVPGVERMFAVEAPSTADGARVALTRAQFGAFRRETSVFTDAYAELSGVDARVDGRTGLFTLTTGNFFQVAGVSAALGRALTPADDEGAASPAILVLSDAGWERLFARDPGALGRVVLVNGVPFTIVGIMPEGFRGLSIVPPDYWTPLSNAGHFRPAYRARDNEVPVRIVGRLKPGLSRENAVAALAAWDAGEPRDRSNRRAAFGMTLVPWRGTVRQPLDALAATAPLFVAFGLVLLIGCANVTNLLLARAVSRQREIGIRLSIGATRGRIVRQLLTESLLLALLAAAAGLAISRLALEVIIGAVMRSWPPEIGNLHLIVPAADWRVAAFLVAGAGASTLSFALLPAFQATRVAPVTMMRGEIVGGARPSRARSLLVALQVTMSALLLISAGVFLRSALAAAGDDSGMRTSDVITVDVPNEAARAAIARAVTDDPLVAAVAVSWPAPVDVPRPAIAESGSARATVAYRLVSPDYFAVLGITIRRGRAFASSEGSNRMPLAVVSEATARALWPDGDPLGQLIRLRRDPDAAAPRAGEPALEPSTATVIGVVRDVAGFRMAPFPRAIVYLPANTTTAGTTLAARIRGDADIARQHILDRLSTIAPDLDQVLALRSVIRMERYFLSVAFWMTVALGALALALTVSGLFSVLSFIVEQRRREIGVRLALGATPRDVGRMLLWQSAAPVGGGLAAGTLAAAGLSAVLLATPAAAAVGRLVRLVDPAAYGASLLVILAACLAAAITPAGRAARVDPMHALRQD